MTTVYFVRHAQADNSIRDGRIRPLTAKGLADRQLVTEFLTSKHINAVFSSPFRRAVDTVADFAEKNGLDIQMVEGFRERKSDHDMPKGHPDFIAFLERQWLDFQYTYSDGECLAEVQRRNIQALGRILLEHQEQNIVIGTHGTALSTILRYYDNSYGFADFMAMLELLPWIVKMRFVKTDCVGIEKINLLQ